MNVSHIWVFRCKYDHIDVSFWLLLLLLLFWMAFKCYEHSLEMLVSLLNCKYKLWKREIRIDWSIQSQGPLKCFGSGEMQWCTGMLNMKTWKCTTAGQCNLAKTWLVIDWCRLGSLLYRGKLIWACTVQVLCYHMDISVCTMKGFPH